MSPLYIKICGFTRGEDLVEAARAGADAVGFNFWPGSKRYLPPAEARALCPETPRALERVGVFVDASLEAILEIAQGCGLDAVQLHGAEPEAFLAPLKAAGYRVLRGVHCDAPELEGAWLGADALLIDAPGGGLPGGTGQLADWERARALATLRPVILAGGLRPENVADAVAEVRPMGIDLASGVESGPGLKDAEAMRELVREARRAHAERALPTAGATP